MPKAFIVLLHDKVWGYEYYYAAYVQVWQQYSRKNLACDMSQILKSGQLDRCSMHLSFAA